MAKLTPAEVVIEIFGIRPLARELEVDPTTIVRWRRGPGGLIPSQYHKPLLLLAQRDRQKLTPEHLVNGKVIS